MYKSLSVVVGAIFGVVLVATCGGKMGGAGDAGAQSGPARMLTADADVNQLASGIVTALDPMKLYNYKKVTDGPLVLTDASGGIPFLYALPAGQDCTEPDISTIAALDGTNGRLVVQSEVHGARLFVSAGEELCVALPTNSTTSSHLAWSGFRPY